MAKPYFKWPGSKAWLVKTLAEILILDFKRIVEPFAGSAAFFLGSGCERAVLGDTNIHVANCLIGVRDSPEEVLFHLSQLQNSLEDYNKLRSFSPINVVQAAARMIFLTNTSWGGLYRENRSGEFNVPFGDNGRSFFCAETIMSASKKLRGAEVFHADYNVTLGESSKDDLIFVDAPYVTSKQSGHFDRYHASRFGWSDQVALARMLTQVKMPSKNILVTCAANRELYQLFPRWTVFEISKRNSMTTYKPEVGTRKEALLVSPALRHVAKTIERSGLGVRKELS